MQNEGENEKLLLKNTDYKDARFIYQSVAKMINLLHRKQKKKMHILIQINCSIIIIQRDCWTMTQTVWLVNPKTQKLQRWT